jgi:hypothetical protein
MLMIESDKITSAKESKAFHGGQNVVRTVLRFISNTKSRIDACLDHTRPSFSGEVKE